jgi:hypothetical protein
MVGRRALARALRREKKTVCHAGLCPLASSGGGGRLGQRRVWVVVDSGAGIGPSRFIVLATY